MTETVLGIKPVGVGCKKIKIEPHLSGLKYAKGTYPTPFGIVKVYHELKADGSVKTTVEAPKEIEIIR
ncbi:MAG: hypothetical protein MJ072_02230 [Clostridia bacterium]|nr:hypothetical protein [Clostridia bacterium]